MLRKKTDILNRMIEANTDEARRRIGEELQNGGYSLLGELLEDLKREVMAAEHEGRLDEISGWLSLGRVVVPEPGNISPAWTTVWDEYERMISFKKEALQAIPVHEREGEWQIVMDNPYTNEAISCYPALSFIEAAYLYAYFRKDLKPNEYIRMQKIVNLLSAHGV